MKESTKSAVEAILRADETVSLSQRRSILNACDTKKTHETFISATEAAKMLGRSRQWVYIAMKDKRISAARDPILGIKIPLSSIELIRNRMEREAFGGDR